MSRRPALITQADVARAIRAAKQAGAADVEVTPTGSILIHLTPESPETQPTAPLEKKRESVL